MTIAAVRTESAIMPNTAGIKIPIAIKKAIPNNTATNLSMCFCFGVINYFAESSLDLRTIISGASIGIPAFLRLMFRNWIFLRSS